MRLIRRRILIVLIAYYYLIERMHEVVGKLSHQSVTDVNKIELTL